MKKDKGVISIFLALIFSILFTFFCVTIDITRINSAKNHLIVAADAAITSVLSDFDIDLYESYGIMTFDKEEVDESSVKSIIDANVTDNSLLNIKVDEVDVEAGGSPFTNNDIMKKQMIHSMKYQGTENLARSVFDKLKEILKIKDIVADQEKIEKFENENTTKKTIDRELAVVEQAKVDAHKAILELAINSPFKELTTVDMGYINNIVSNNGNNIMLSNIKTGKSALDYAKKALANDKVYKNKKFFNSYVHNKYSYFYSKMILEMYYIYAEKVHKEVQQNTSNNENSDISQDEVTSNIKTPEPALIDYKIRKFKESYDNGIKSQTDKLVSNLKNLQSWKDTKFIFFTEDMYGVKEAISSLDYLIKNNSDHLKLLRDNYTNLKTEDAKKSGEESLKSYEELLNIDKLKSYKIEFEKINNHINSVIENIKMIDSMNNLMIKYAKEWAAKNTSHELFILLDEQIGKSISFASIKSISSNKEIMKHEVVKNILNKDQYQVETLRGLQLSSVMNIEPMHEAASDFEDFVDKFDKMESKDKSISAVIDRHLKERGTSNNLSKYNLPSNTKGDETESLSQSLGNISTDNIISLNNFGDLLKLADKAAGGLLDNAYLVEYVMTNFKDMIGDTNPKRIPEVTDNDTKLGFEIEYIISGKNTDKKNSEAMVDELVLKRTALNAVTLLSNKQPRIKGFIQRASIAISTATQGTLPMPIVKTILIGGWSALEARYDVIDLLNGKEAPILKQGLTEWVTDLGLKDDDIKLKPGSDSKSDNDEMDKLKGTIDKANLKNPANPKGGSDAYNSQASKMALDYIDFVRLRLLTMNKDKLIDRCQNLISANQDISDHEKYSTDLEVTINQSNVNILFNTPVFSSNGGINKFNSFSFKRGYN